MRQRLLYVPIFAAFEADQLREAVADWAEVESFDGPGAGSRAGEDPGGPEGMAAAGAAHLDALGWDRCVLVCDSHAQAGGIELALRDPRVAGIAISHASARYGPGGERPALNPSIYEAAGRFLATDYRSFARAITQLTQGALDDAWVDSFIEQVPRDTAEARTGGLPDGLELAIRLRGEELEILLAAHRGCMMWTPEAFEDAVAALPQARAVHFDEVPLSDPGYHAELRELCARVFG
ncbi:MAG TPA: hypothetical protein VF715_17445 [Thermoleophilaceae bacterium]|jgi:hypothetical protein